MRVVCLRQGVVIARGAPALRLLALPVRLFVGGPIGGGRQWFSWVDLVDLVGLYRLALAEPSLHGALNVTAPEPVHQADLARAMGRVLHRPARIPVPGLPVRLLAWRHGHPRPRQPPRHPGTRHGGRLHLPATGPG